jgi:hypothetical protein
VITTSKPADSAAGSQFRESRRLAIAPRERKPQTLINALLHEGSYRCNPHSDSRGHTKFLALLQDLDGQFAADRRKPFEKSVQRIAVLNMRSRPITAPACAARHSGHTNRRNTARLIASYRRAPAIRDSVSIPGLETSAFGVHSKE